MKRINVSTKTFPNKYALVDDEDFDWLNQWFWTASKPPKNSAMYAAKRTKPYKMHHLLVEKKPGEVVDHIDGNGLNNQKRNLRVCSLLENSRNRKKMPGSPFGKPTSKHKGVGLIAGSFRARISISGKTIYIGTFKSESSAALAYNEAARKYFGEYAFLNKIEDPDLFLPDMSIKHQIVLPDPVAELARI